MSNESTPSLKVGILSVAHLHAGSYVHGLKLHSEATLVGIHHSDRDFADRVGADFFENSADLISQVDAVVICAENNRHADFVELAAAAGKHILCEKPVAAKQTDFARIRAAVAEAGVQFMTAFPCRVSPAYQRLKARVANGEIGEIRAICATNRGSCPMSWFVQTELSGGGAMIDHVVHVTDLLRDLLQEEPVRVQAQIGNRIYDQEWEDTAMVTMDFPSGIFATLDSSWSRPGSYKTWGDVMLTVTGTLGVIELDMFGAGLDVFRTGGTSHTVAGYGSDLDALMIDAFVQACLGRMSVPVTLEDGIRAAEVALAGYDSVKSGSAVVLA